VVVENVRPLEVGRKEATMSWVPEIYLEITRPGDDELLFDKYDDTGRRNLLAAIREFVSTAPQGEYLEMRD
jgi:hypothetical protein